MTLLWAYVWKNSDGSRHEATLEASTKEQAFQLLREKGIKPIKVTQVLRKRDRTLRYLRRFGLILCVAVAVGFIAFDLGRTRTSVAPAGRVGESTPLDGRAGSPLPAVMNTLGAPRDAFLNNRMARPLPRKQAALDGLDLDALFTFEAERYLIAFVSPGIIPASTNAIPSDIIQALATPITLTESDTPRTVELKGIVTGLKNEIALFLSSGKSLAEIAEWLEMRQRMEYAFRKQLIAGRDRDAANLPALNAKLRSLGLAEIPR